MILSSHHPTSLTAVVLTLSLSACVNGAKRADAPGKQTAVPPVTENTSETPTDAREQTTPFETSTASDHRAISNVPSLPNQESEVTERDAVRKSAHQTQRVLSDMASSAERQKLHSATGREYLAQAQGMRLERGIAGGSAYHIPAPDFHTEQYDTIDEKGFLTVANRPLSTFSIDVDTASYSNVRRMLTQGILPPAGAVRIEEFVNYFPYSYPEPGAGRPFSVTTEVAVAPWKPEHRLVLIGLQGKRIAPTKVPARNLVFLLDVSGSMQPADKLPLVVKALTNLTAQLRAQDHVAIVVYAGASGTVLEPTCGSNKQAITDALSRLHAGGSTNGADGIRLAYDLARKHFDVQSINRVILATDGDFNVGTTSRSELVTLIEKQRESGIFLTVLGVGTGNLKDATMEQLADRGNGNYAYLDTAAEARKVLIEQAGGTLVTIAKDVKIQVEFNPAQVQAYRLIGYENRRLQDKDFNEDTKDAGEIGAGHSVTALYEIVPVGIELDSPPSIDPLRYQKPQARTDAAAGDELLTVKLRYKEPLGDQSKLVSVAVTGAPAEVASTSENLRFAAAVTSFGMVLRESEERGTASFDMAQELGRSALGEDRHAYRAEFLRLVAQARNLAGDATSQVTDSNEMPAVYGR